jgi:predicted dehydrogenase
VAAGAKAKKHLFVEKPLGMGSRDSFAMAKAIEKADTLFSTGYFMRGWAPHLFLKEHVERGTFGQITRIRGSNCHSGALGNWFAAKPEANVAEDWRWMADPAISGVGAFGDLGTHSLDIMLWLMGEVESATAMVSTGIKRYENSGGFCDESGEGLLKFKNGAIGTLAAAWDDVSNPVSLLISGTEAHAVIVQGKLHFKCDKLGINDDKPCEQIPQGISSGIDSWLEAVAGNTSAKIVPVREAAYRPAVMEAMYQGARKGKWVAPREMK